VGYMLQKDLLLPWRNIEQNVLLPQELPHLRTCSKAEVAELFVLFGLEAFRKAYPRELSGGMRQRANLLRTYTLQSDLLLLDEPFGALDALTKQSLQYWFLEMSRQRPRSILLITHDIREAILLADQVLVLSMRPCRSLASFDVRGIRSSEELEREIFSYLDPQECEPKDARR
ncbi:MAG: ATP-binding cassette domain-containing protein, partial [Spirochaetota bacterium]